MNRFTLPVGLCLSAVFLLSSRSIFAAEPALPELKPLDKFVGSWTGTIDGTDVTSKSKMQWVLGGRFVEQKYTTSTGDEGMILRTYDPRSKKYMMWTFDSNGTAMQQAGTWDDKTSTMTLTSDVGDVSIITTEHFPDEDTQVWSITVKDTDGNVLQSLKGKNVRKSGTSDEKSDR